MTVILGIDPGARYTGVVIRDGIDDEVVDAVTIIRDDHDTPEEYATGVLARILRLWEASSRRPGLVAIEQVVAPGVYFRGEKQVLHPDSILGTALVAGHVYGWAWSDGAVDIEWVAPGGNGQGALDGYPASMRPTRGKGKGTDKLRHVRSAWDVAGLGLRQWQGRLVATTREVDAHG